MCYCIIMFGWKWNGNTVFYLSIDFLEILKEEKSEVKQTLLKLLQWAISIFHKCLHFYYFILVWWDTTTFSHTHLQAHGHTLSLSLTYLYTH